MRPRVRSMLLTLLLTGLIAPGAALGQTNPAPAPKAATVTSAKPPENFKDVLGTVNGEPISRAELVNLLSRYQIPIGDEEQVYQDAMDTLVNTHLVNLFLTRQRIPVTEEKVDEAIASLERQLKQDGNDLATELLRTGTSMADVRKEYANRIRWIEYLNTKATDPELRKFVATHKDLFSGTQVKASHILLKSDPKLSNEDKEKVREKLLAIKKDVEANKMTFAEAANKHSEDPANADGAGGDIGYFTLNGGVIEEFATAAFSLPKGAISDPVETPYGYHLIQVTDRKEGTPLDFDQQKPLVKQIFAQDLQKQLLAGERKSAKIEIKPMPKDLFPKQSPAVAPAAKPEAPK